MGIPFQIPAKSVEDQDKPRCKKFRFVIFVKHAQDNTSNSRKKAAKQGSVFQEKSSEFFSDSKDKVSVFYMNDFERHGGSTVNGVFIATGGTKAAFATERNKL